MFRRRQLLASLLTALLGLASSGCLHLDQQLTLTDDNRGTFSLSVSLPKAVHARYIAADDGPGAPWRIFFDATAGIARFDQAAGFDRNLSYRVVDVDDRMTIVIAGRLTDARAALASGLLGPWKLEQTDAGSRLYLAFTPPTTRAMPPDDVLRTLTKGMRLSIAIDTPTPIGQTTGRRPSPTRATWQFTANDAEILVRPPTVEVTW